MREKDQKDVGNKEEGDVREEKDEHCAALTLFHSKFKVENL